MEHLRKLNLNLVSVEFLWQFRGVLWGLNRTRSIDTREAAIYQRADEGFGVNIVCGGK